MKQYALIFLLLGCSCSSGQTGKDLGYTPADSLKNNETSDTIFIHREITRDYYHAIYIDKSKETEPYKWLTTFEFGEYDKQSYAANKEAIEKEIPGIFKHQNTFDLPQNWLPLHQYKNNYYLYAPADRGTAGRRIINDQEFIYWYMDGPYPVPLTAVHKLSDTEYTLTILSPFDYNSKPVQITVYIIDPVTKMSVFKFFNATNNYQYQLYVPAEHADNFDLIVNYCKEQKQMEYDFEVIDYEKIIKSR